MKRLNLLLILLGLFLCVGFSACGDDDDDSSSIPSGFCGCYYFDDTSGGYSKDCYYTFYEDGTGEYRKEGAINTFITRFSYAFSGNTIKCKGIHIGVDNDANVDVDANWSKTIQYSGGTIIVDGNRYKKIS